MAMFGVFLLFVQVRLKHLIILLLMFMLRVLKLLVLMFLKPKITGASMVLVMRHLVEV